MAQTATGTPRQLSNFRARLACRAFAALLCFLSLPGRAVPAAPRPLLTTAQASGDTLPSGKPVERQIAANETHSYQITADAGQYLRVTINHRSLDLEVSLFAPGGQKLAAMKNPHGLQGPGTLAIKTETAGAYRLEVRPLAASGGDGRYEVSVEEGASVRDSNALAAEKAFHEAFAFYIKATAESLPQALTKFEEALALSSHDIDRANILAMIGHSYNALGRKQKAFEFYNQALALRQALGDIQGQMLSYNSVAAIYADFGETQKALEYFQQALMVAREFRDPRAQAITLNNVGLTYYEMGDDQKALEHYNEARSFIKGSWDHNAIASVLTNIGLVYERLGDRQKALATYKEALAVPASTINRKQPLILHHLGRLYETLGEKQPAAEHLEQSLARARAAGDRFVEAMALNSLGRLYASLGETQKGIEHCGQALTLRRDMGNRSGEAASLYELARIERERGNLVAAQSLIEEALDILESLRVKIDVQELRASYFASVQNYYEFYVDLLMRLERANAAGGYAAAALRTSERRRARTLLETLREGRADIRSGVDAGLLARERALRQRFNAAASHLMRLLGGKHAPEQAEAARKEFAAARAELQQVEAQIKATSPHYAALTRPAPLSLQEIQKEALDADTLLLEYALGDERSYLWAVTPASMKNYELPSRAEIEGAARRVYQLLTARNRWVKFETIAEREARVAHADAEYPEAAAALSRMILGPVAAQLRQKRLLIVSDGALQYLPFAALPVPNPAAGQGYTPLALHHEIVNLPSASTLAVLRRELSGRKPAPKSVVVLADPVFDKEDDRFKVAMAARKGASLAAVARTRGVATSADAEFTRAARDVGALDEGLRMPRLPFTRREAEEIMALAPAPSRKVALDFDASHATALDPELGQYRYVHFATHGFLNSQHPDLSGIALSMIDEQGKQQDGFLRAHEIYNLKLPAELVVLSGCRTGLGKEIRGEGLIGLTRGFMYAGAARVLVSLWDVGDRSTAELMARFYRGMLGKERLTPAAALRAAQVSMWKEKGWQSPYYWAAFVLQGEPK